MASGPSTSSHRPSPSPAGQVDDGSEVRSRAGRTHADASNETGVSNNLTTQQQSQRQASNAQRRKSISDAELVEIRAAQRTFEGAYIRTALGQFGFSLVVLRIFTNEFYSIGALYAAYGAGVLAIAAYRRHQGNSQFFLEEVGVPGSGEHVQKFRTSGNVVVVMTAMSLMAYVAMLVLVVRLGD